MVEQWGIYEISVDGKSDGNPFVDYELIGVFQGAGETVRVDGFYDGEGSYKVRFMPSFTGRYSYEVFGNALNQSIKGEFQVEAASEANHGPVRVAAQYHFAYEDGTPYYSVGTTCYAWTHQIQARQQQTLATLANGYFNKIRFCVFPKHYDYNFEDPITFPFHGKPMDKALLTKLNFDDFNGNPSGNEWDFSRFNPAHFRNIERRIQDLMELGIEADLILMHPYDRWGFSEMTPEQDDRYFRYVIARLGAYRNVWWSLANEYDLMKTKTVSDWERYADTLVKNDPYRRLRSIHNCHPFYDHNRPWVTHCSIQHTETKLAAAWRARYQKPVVLDEIMYEGNINHNWGNISAQELVRRFWDAAVRGGYAGHGETYLEPDDILWWSHGGVLHGKSAQRLKFLHDILSETPGLGLSYLPRSPFTPMRGEDPVAVPEDVQYLGSYYLLYFSMQRPSFKVFDMEDEYEYEAEVIDTWHMSIEKQGPFKGRFTVELPGREYIAIRIRRKK